MSGDNRSGTVAEDYSSCYYNETHLGGHGDYSWDNPHWRGFFEMAADRIIGLGEPGKVLDVGCARGLLVQALAARGVDAHGFDVSRHAIESADESVRGRLSVASATEPIEARYDLITCIEVLEHMSSRDAQLAVDSMTRASDLILFSSSPSDHDEPTHINTHLTADWAAWFAERGFFRRVDVDLSFLTHWAVLFERADLDPRQLAHRYEILHAKVNAERVEKSHALLESYREIQALNAHLEGGTAEEISRQLALVKEFEAEVLEARHSLLVNRDHVVGTEAEIGRLNREVARLADELKQATRRVSALTKRKNDLALRVDTLRSRVAAARERNKALSRRVAELEQRSAPPASLARRVARRVRRG